jgi:YTH domain-containing family protein
VNKNWSSTNEGNEKLEAVYQDSLKNGNYPIFLFFSVNQSSQFCGVAQMTTPLDFHSDFSTWTKQKQWQGTFNVAWLFVKDIPNKQFKALPNKFNDNKPVANSRDTQEVPFSEGMRMLEIFRDFKEESSIFDDFESFEQ